MTSRCLTLTMLLLAACESMEPYPSDEEPTGQVPDGGLAEDAGQQHENDGGEGDGGAPDLAPYTTRDYCEALIERNLNCLAPGLDMFANTLDTARDCERALQGAIDAGRVSFVESAARQCGKEFKARSCAWSDEQTFHPAIMTFGRGVPYFVHSCLDAFVGNGKASDACHGEHVGGLGNAECQSGLCMIDGCEGECVEALRTGDDCKEGACSDDDVCSGEDSRCVPRHREGEECDPSAPESGCQRELACLCTDASCSKHACRSARVGTSCESDATCADKLVCVAGACQEVVLGPGQFCEQRAPCRPDLICMAETDGGAKKCLAPALGLSCGGSSASCPAGSVCNGDVCVPAAQVGEPCNGCAEGLACDPISLLCIEPPDLGEACSPYLSRRECKKGLVCVYAGLDGNACVPVFAVEGEPCVHDDACAEGLSCYESKCSPTVPVGLGEHCGEHTSCEEGLLCATDGTATCQAASCQLLPRRPLAPEPSFLPSEVRQMEELLWGDVGQPNVITPGAIRSAFRGSYALDCVAAHGLVRPGKAFLVAEASGALRLVSESGASLAYAPHASASFAYVREQARNVRDYSLIARSNHTAISAWFHRDGSIDVSLSDYRSEAHCVRAQQGSLVYGKNVPALFAELATQPLAFATGNYKVVFSERGEIAIYALPVTSDSAPLFKRAWRGGFLFGELSQAAGDFIRYDVEPAHSVLQLGDDDLQVRMNGGKVVSIRAPLDGGVEWK